ncbi:hypothetical protein B0O99DRAFT_643921 [Bisporella sp. PMI_857]|nr:hypothetical protein B0O99DRAFT_643921 [Bisporella sp. PMI_857]
MAIEATETPTRRAYKGSCHCGLTQYIAYITLPPNPITADPTIATTTRIRKCNCSTCQKTSFFNIRLADSSKDFYLLSPITSTSSEGATGGIKTGEDGLKDYTCFEGDIHWYFCSRCGVRCFNITGQGGVSDVELEGKMVRAWTPKRGGVDEMGRYCQFSLNATSIEPGQEGFDMREWHEKGWIVYLDCLNEVEDDRFGRPCEGGMY